jgi:glutathione S-transferase
MKLTAWVTIASLLMYIWVFAKVGKARGVHNVPAPSTDGPTEFLVAMRVQANTVEQLILFLPLLWMCAMYMSDLYAAGFGAVWVIGRIVYALGYYQAPKNRSAGFLISSAAGVGLLVCTIIGLVTH